MFIPESFVELVSNLQILPGVGEKTAERFAFCIEKKEQDEIEMLSNAIINFKKKIKKCLICNCMSDDEICNICTNPNRNSNILCVVEDSKTLFSIEKTNKYNGKYYVLNGLISPSNGIDPDDIEINKLINMISNFKEVIFAFNPSIDSDLTLMYIEKKIENSKTKISRLSYGIPLGADIDYLDPIMIEKAFEDRKEINKI